MAMGLSFCSQVSVMTSVPSTVRKERTFQFSRAALYSPNIAGTIFKLAKFRKTKMYLLLMYLLICQVPVVPRCHAPRQPLLALASHPPNLLALHMILHMTLASPQALNLASPLALAKFLAPAKLLALPLRLPNLPGFYLSPSSTLT
jgi:hypothetical protein